MDVICIAAVGHRDTWTEKSRYTDLVSAAAYTDMLTTLDELASKHYQDQLEYRGHITLSCLVKTDIYCHQRQHPFTYDHRTLNTGLPVRSALLKQRTGGSVVRWVTTGESPLLYVFANKFLTQRSTCTT
jgi:hypothetical protein